MKTVSAAALATLLLAGTSAMAQQAPALPLRNPLPPEPRSA